MDEREELYDSTSFEIDDSIVCLEGEEVEVTVCGEKTYYREGTWCEKNDDGDFEPDWSLTWFYKDKDNPQDYFYYEQDPPETAIYNLRNILSQNN